MRNHLTVTIQTVSGEHCYRIPILWVGSFLILLCFTLGIFHFYPTFTPWRTTNAFQEAPKEPSVLHASPIQDRLNPQWIPELESLEDLFKPAIHPGQKNGSKDGLKNRVIERSNIGSQPTPKKPRLPPKPERKSQTIHTVALHPPPLSRQNSGLDGIIFTMIPNGSPVEFKGINSSYGNRTHPKNGVKKFHPGIDLFADMNTPVVAPADGIVEFAGLQSIQSYGTLITLRHEYGFRTCYAHLAEVRVKEGDFVRRGDIIGFSGSSGRSSGPHLHYEVRFFRRTLDPAGFLHWNEDDLIAPSPERQVAWYPLINQIKRQQNNEMPLALRLALNQSGFFKPL
ncbi:MAG: M23 family metallopeptidase [Magnetococcales bacterium]|nr:M23 family metallopeptidase [Magnetococcales bacterium]